MICDQLGRPHSITHPTDRPTDRATDRQIRSVSSSQSCSSRFFVLKAAVANFFNYCAIE